MSFIPAYHNDGTGRDTYINYAGSSWTNPLPGGLFYKSNGNYFGEDGGDEAEGTFSDSTTYPGKTLFGKSRYGTTVKQSAGRLPDAAADGAGGPADGLDGKTRGLGLGTTGTPGADGGENFDPEATALNEVPVDTANPEQRMRQPGHTLNPVDATGGSTYNGVADPWVPPNQVDNTLMRLEPTWESTCHYGLRTGRFYTDDQAPAHENTLPEKGVNWNKSRYYP